jgi:hypothetical protein
MLPPYQQRGVPVSPSAFNLLIDLVKSSLLNGITGGTFFRSINGTTINLQQGPVGGSGAGGSVIPCPFQCTDASDETTLKVEVAWGLIYQQLPLGMMPDNKPPLRLTVTQTCYIYSQIAFDTDTLLVTGVSFSVETTIQSNTATTQYNLIAVVTISEGEDKVITSISNICQQPFPSPCSLAPA